MQLHKEHVTKEYHAGPTKEHILQQFDKMSQQLSNEGNFFEVSKGFIKRGDELLYSNYHLKVTLKTKD